MNIIFLYRNIALSNETYEFKTKLDFILVILFAISVIKDDFFECRLNKLNIFNILM